MKGKGEVKHEELDVPARYDGGTYLTPKLSTPVFGTTAAVEAMQ